MLLAIIGLWETTAAAAAGAVSIPIIIHLLNRKRFRVVTWAAMKFLPAAQKQITRRMRLAHFILLAVRCLLVLLIVAAMASVTDRAEDLWAYMDWQGRPVKGQTGRAHNIVVIDA